MWFDWQSIGLSHTVKLCCDQYSTKAITRQSKI